MKWTLTLSPAQDLYYKHQATSSGEHPLQTWNKHLTLKNCSNCLMGAGVLRRRRRSSVAYKPLTLDIKAEWSHTQVVYFLSIRKCKLRAESWKLPVNNHSCYSGSSLDAAWCPGERHRPDTKAKLCRFHWHCSLTAMPPGGRASNLSPNPVRDGRQLTAASERIKEDHRTIVFLLFSSLFSLLESRVGSWER